MLNETDTACVVITLALRKKKEEPPLDKEWCKGIPQSTHGNFMGNNVA
jgi:hypothetical protein